MKATKKAREEAPQAEAQPAPSASS